MNWRFVKSCINRDNADSKIATINAKKKKRAKIASAANETNWLGHKKLHTTLLDGVVSSAASEDVKNSWSHFIHGNSSYYVDQLHTVFSISICMFYFPQFADGGCKFNVEYIYINNCIDTGCGDDDRITVKVGIVLVHLYTYNWWAVYID